MIPLNIKRKIWSFKQPLTLLPICSNATLSDLFVWRSSDLWQTTFELIDIPSLFDDSLPSNEALFVFFDQNGNCVLKKLIPLQPNRRNTLNISDLIGTQYGEAGTFAVFHTKSPPEIVEFGSYIAERGYISYKYQNSPLRSYVHGNFDAIARHYDGELQLIGGKSFLYRNYNLQFCFDEDAIHELVLVNPSPVLQKFTVKTVLHNKNKIINSQNFKLPSGGMKIFSINTQNINLAKVVIKSKLVMARPLVFSIKNCKVNVFHG